MKEVWVEWPGIETGKVKMVSFLDMPVGMAVQSKQDLRVMVAMMYTALGKNSDAPGRKLEELNVREALELAESWIAASQSAEDDG